MIPPAPVRPRASVAETLAVYLRPRVLIVLFLGFSAGLPLALSGSTLQVWMTQSGVDIKTIGLFAAVGTPYTIKFLWAPIVDALDVPVLARLLGRRRGWLLLSQFLLVVSIVLLGFCDPSAAPWLVALAALLVATASATQDIVIDAFRVESLPESEQAAGMASYVAAYRIGMLVSTAGALFLVTRFEVMGFGKNAAWTAGYIAMAGFVVIGMVTTLIATEPAKSDLAQADHAAHARENVVARVARTAYTAFTEFLSRDAAVAVLVFVVLFKFTDALAGAMTAPFVIKIGFSRDEYAAVVNGARLSVVDQPVDRRRPAGARQSRILVAGDGRRRHRGAHFRDHGREFHQRDRDGDLRRLSVGAVQQSAPHRDAIRALDRARGGRAYLSVARGRLYRGGDRMGVVFRDLRRGGAPESRLAGLAATARTFRQARCALALSEAAPRQNGVRLRIAADSVPSSR
jgi:MFS family permease